MANKELPTRRDYREAKGYLEDFLNGSPCVADGRVSDLAEELMGHATRVKVLRHNDTLRIEFDLSDDGSIPLPEASDGEQITGRVVSGTVFPDEPDGTDNA